MQSTCQCYYRPQMDRSRSHPIIFFGCAALSFLAITCSCAVTFLSTSPPTAPSIARANQVQVQIPGVTPTVKVAEWHELVGAKKNQGESVISQQSLRTDSLLLKGFLGIAVSTVVLPLVYFLKRWSWEEEEEEGEEEDWAEEAWAITATVGEIALKKTAELPVKDTTGSTVGTTELSLKTAGANSRYVIHRKLVAEMANQRESNAHTKTRGEVSGGGKKPYKQKGTGGARRGSNRSPLMRHGGVAFGPRNTKNYEQKVNRKEGQLAISSLLQNRAPLITVIQGIEGSMSSVSTQQAVALLQRWKDQTKKGDKVLLVIDAPDGLPPLHPLALSTNNLPSVRLLTHQQLCVTELLWPHQILVSEKALEALKRRFGASAEDSGESDTGAV